VSLSFGRAVRLASLLWVSACGVAGSPPRDGGGGSTETVEIGVGESSFTPLQEGDAVTIVKGPQGGFHITGALRASPGFVPRAMEVRYRVLTADGTELSLNAYRVTLLQVGEHLEWYGLLGLVPDPAVISGKQARLRIELRDVNGQEAADERLVSPQGP
jgi:hypothetical protein